MVNGWIKIHRQVIEKGWFSKSNYVHIWCYLLIKASYSDKEYMWNGENVTLEPGQFITGRKQISKDTGISETTVERILTFFEEKEKQIGQQKTSTSRLISILNYTKYQECGQQTDNERTASGQRADTKKEGKEIEEIKEVATTPENGFQKLDQRGKLIFEMFRRNLDLTYTDSAVIVEVNKFLNRYPDIMANRSGALINTWCGNMGKVKTEIKGQITNQVTGQKIYV